MFKNNVDIRAILNGTHFKVPLIRILRMMRNNLLRKLEFIEQFRLYGYYFLLHVSSALQGNWITPIKMDCFLIVV